MLLEFGNAFRITNDLKQVLVSNEIESDQVIIKS